MRFHHTARLVISRLPGTRRPIPPRGLSRSEPRLLVLFILVRGMPLPRAARLAALRLPSPRRISVPKEWSWSEPLSLALTAPRRDVPPPRSTGSGCTRGPLGLDRAIDRKGNGRVRRGWPPLVVKPPHHRGARGSCARAEPPQTYRRSRSRCRGGRDALFSNHCPGGIPRREFVGPVGGCTQASRYARAVKGRRYIVLGGYAPILS